MGWWSRLRESSKRRREPDPQIRIVEAGLDLVSPLDQRVVASVRWADVTKIHTHKIDLITTDCICLLFELNNAKAPVRISEEWNGFADLFGPLAAAFPSIPSDWYVDEMTPAFEAMHRVLYDAATSLMIK